MLISGDIQPGLDTFPVGWRETRLDIWTDNMAVHIFLMSEGKGNKMVEVSRAVPLHDAGKVACRPKVDGLWILPYDGRLRETPL